MAASKVAKIKLRTDGMTELLTAGDIALAVLSPLCEVRRNETKNGFWIVDNFSRGRVQIFVNDLTGYTLEPAAFIPITTDMWGWWELLTRYFFPVTFPHAISDEIVNNSNILGQTVTDALNILAVGGGGGVINTNIYEVTTPTYNILTTNYIIVATMNCTLYLPTISVFGQRYEIHANGFDVDVVPDTGAGDLINDLALISISSRDCLLISSIQANNWGAK